jgi:hypothetical protein
LRPRRVAQRFALQPAVVYDWSRRFQALGLEGLATRRRVETPITRHVSVQAMMDVFQLLDNTPRLGHDRVQMALDSLGSRDGHTTVWPLVALDTQAHPQPPQASRRPSAAERPLQATAPHQVWFADLRSRVHIDGQWLDSMLIFDGYSRAIVGAGCFDRQHRSWLSHVCRQASARWGAPDTVVSEHGAVCLAWRPCRAPLGIQWRPTTKGHPWQHLAESGVAVQRRRLDADVLGCTERTLVSQQHAPVVPDDQCWGHGAHTRQDAQGRIYDLSPAVVLGHAQGRPVGLSRLRRVFRLRHGTRTVRRQGQMRRCNVGIYVDRERWGHTVEGLIDDERLRMEWAERLLVSDPCGDDTR